MHPTAQSVQVCADDNNDYRCSSPEQTTTPSGTGEFVLDAPKGRIVVEYFDSSDASRPTNILVSGAENSFFASPLTTLLYVHAEQTEQPLAAAEADIRSKLNFPEEAGSLAENYLSSEASLSRELGRLALTHQAKWFEVTQAAIDKKLQQKVVHSFVNSPVDFSNTAALEAFADGGTGDVFGALPGLQDLPIIQGMKLGVGYDVLGDRLKTAAQCARTRGLDGIRQVQAISRNDVHYEYRLIRTREDLTDFFNIDASVGIHGGDFDVSVFFKLLKNYEEHRNKLFAAVKIDARVADIHLDAPELDPALAELYLNQYPKFRKQCGDMFLSVLTVGGVYYGIIEIDTRNAQDKLQIEAEIGVHVKGEVDVDIDIGFERLVYNAFDNQNVSVTIHSSGFPGGYEPVTDFRSFMLDVTRFYCNLRGLSAATCEEICDRKIRAYEGEPADIGNVFAEVDSTLAEVLDPNEPDDFGVINGPIKGVVYAKFDDYGQLVQTVPTISVAESEHNKKIMGRLYNAYYGLYEETHRMLAFPTLYEDMDAHQDRIQGLRYDLEVYLENIATLLNKCAHPTNPVCEQLEEKSQVIEHVFGETLPTTEDGIVDLAAITARQVFPGELRRTLPAIRELLPRSCIDIKNHPHLHNKKNEYLLYLGGSENRPFWASCYGLEEQRLPEAYLLLRNRSVVQTDFAGRLVEMPSYNYSMFKGLPISTAPDAGSPASDDPPMGPDSGSGDETSEGESETPSSDSEQPAAGTDPEDTVSGEQLKAYDLGSIITAYQRIKIQVNHDSIVVDPNQYKAFSQRVPEAERDLSLVNFGPPLVEFRLATWGDLDNGRDHEYELLGRFESAPLGWTKVCDRNLEAGTSVGNSTDTIRTANINTRGTPFVLPEDMKMATSIRFDPMYNLVARDEADAEASDLGARLLVLVDQDDANRFANILRSLGFDGVWLNLQVIQHPVTNEVIMVWGVDGINFNPFAEPPSDVANKCPLLKASTEENGVGEVVLEDCDVAHPYVIEYAKAEVDVEMSEDRQALDIAASHLYGNCITVYPRREIALEYNADIAAALDLIDSADSAD